MGKIISPLKLCHYPGRVRIPGAYASRAKPGNPASIYIYITIIYTLYGLYTVAFTVLLLGSQNSVSKQILFNFTYLCDNMFITDR